MTSTFREVIGIKCEMNRKEVQITDGFFKHYISLVRDVIIPYQWKILNDPEESHCIRNFRIAAGEEDGGFKGAVFQDSDLAKWLEAVAYCLEGSPDPGLERLADEAIRLIGKAQQEDGYLNTYFTIRAPKQRFLNLQEGHELYTAGHMMEAAVAYYQATGKREFLDIMCRNADLLCREFGEEEGKCHGYPGHQEIELALVKLYEATGVERYLRLAKFFIDGRGVGENYFLNEESGGKTRIFPEFADYEPLYSQSHLPVREQETAEGHAVRAVYMYCAMAELAGYCRDRSLLKSCEKLWRNIVSKRMYITGGIGSSGILERFTTDYDLPNDRGYAETCASIGLALFGKRMAQLTRDASYMDVVELELYNNILAGIALDGTHFFYVNPLEVWPGNCLSRTSLEHVRAERQRWFGVACCPPNIARTLSSLGQFLCFKDDGELYINLYLGCRIDTELGGAPVQLELLSGMPKEPGAVVNIDASAAKQEFVAAFRIPSYAGRFELLEEGGTAAETVVKAGYCRVRVCPGRHRYTINWRMEAEFVRSHPNVRANSGKAALKRGPLVYCFEEIDNGGNVPALFADTGAAIEEHCDGSLPGGIPWLGIKGARLRDDGWADTALYSNLMPVFQCQDLKAVPYFYWNNREAGEMQVWIKELLSIIRKKEEV